MKKLALLFLFLFSFTSFAVIHVEKAVVTYVYGMAKYKHGENGQWEKLKLKTVLKNGDVVKTLRRSKVEITIFEKKKVKKILMVKPNSQLEIPDVIQNQNGLIQFIKMFVGFLYVNGKKVDGEFNVQTPKAICGIRGTRYTLEVRGPREILTVLSGKVLYSTLNKKISRLVKKGEKIVVENAQKVKVQKVNIIKEQKKIIKEFKVKEIDKVESAVENAIDALGSILEQTETSTVGNTKRTGNLHLSYPNQ